MSTGFQQLQAQLAASLNGIVPLIAPAGGNTDPLTTLIDAMPYYGSMDWQNAHRGGIVNLLVTSLPNNAIAAQPAQWDGLNETSYSYQGNYSGYNDAFFNGIAQSATAAAILQAVQQVNPAMNSSWWGTFCLATLTDQINQAGAAQVNVNQLTTDLATYNGQLQDWLSATYLATFMHGYPPTQAALDAIGASNAGPATALVLQNAIVNGTFTANINTLIAQGGDSTAAATWFLFNLWIMLMALDETFDVDSCISAAIKQGLDVPEEVQPRVWWTGSYTSYFAALAGADIAAQYPAVSGTIAADMPIQVLSCVPRFGCTGSDSSVSNGYCQSLTYWGRLNTYNPPS